VYRAQKKRTREARCERCGKRSASCRVGLGMLIDCGLRPWVVAHAYLLAKRWEFLRDVVGRRLWREVVGQVPAEDAEGVVLHHE
jgi:hypothetical protein